MSDEIRYDQDPAAAGHPAGDSLMDDGWHRALPETIPRPTFWPAVLAFGATLIGFGVQTSFLLSGVGAVIFVVATARWIGEIHHEHQE